MTPLSSTSPRGLNRGPAGKGSDCGCGAGDYEEDQDDRRTFDTDFDDHAHDHEAAPAAWPDHIDIPAPVTVPEAAPARV